VVCVRKNLRGIFTGLFVRCDTLADEKDEDEVIGRFRRYIAPSSQAWRLAGAPVPSDTAGHNRARRVAGQPWVIKDFEIGIKAARSPVARLGHLQQGTVDVGARNAK
jgi:hypothetical protein